MAALFPAALRWAPLAFAGASLMRAVQRNARRRDVRRLVPHKPFVDLPAALTAIRAERSAAVHFRPSPSKAGRRLPGSARPAMHRIASNTLKERRRRPSCPFRQASVRIPRWCRIRAPWPGSTGRRGKQAPFDAIGAQVALFGRIRHEVPVPGTVRMLARLVLEHLHAPFFQRQLELVATGDFTAVASRAELEIDVQGVLRHRHASFTSADTLRWTCLRDAKPAGLRTRPGGSAPG